MAKKLLIIDDEADIREVARASLEIVGGFSVLIAVASAHRAAAFEACRWLIDTCAPGGGYILSMGVSVDKVNPENILAIVQTAKEYGAYSQ